MRLRISIFFTLLACVSLVSCGKIWGTLTLNSHNSSSLSYSSCAYGTTFAVGTAANITPATTQGIGPFSVSPALPAGLSLNAVSGVISGTPTTVTPQTLYTISSGSNSTTIYIQTVQGYIVNSLTDGTDVNPGNLVCETGVGNGVCTLRAAIGEADADGAGTWNIILPSGKINLGSLISVTNKINLYGSCRDTSIVDGQGGAYDMFQLNAGALVLGFQNLTIENSAGTAIDANFNNNNTLSISNVTFLGHTSHPVGWGGGASTVTITNSIFKNMTVAAGPGAINAGTATWNITGCLFSSLTTPGSAGAILIPAAATTMNITNSTFYNNNGFVAAVTSNGAGPVINIVNSTIANNTSTSGFNAGGVDTTSGGTLNLTNTIVSNNTGGNCLGTVNSNGGNLSYPADANCNFVQASDISSANPLLGSLQDNGGASYTMALQTGSPALNKGVVGSCPATDQRGYQRLGDGKCDSGAYEHQ